MSAAPDPTDPAFAPTTSEISEVAQMARDRLHEEIERVRLGVEEMLDEHEPDDGDGEDLRRELERLRIETRDYVKKRVRKSEKRLERSVREIGARTDELEQRIDEAEREAEEAEARIHTSTEQMLDGLLDEVRSIADRLAEMPRPQPQPPVAAGPTPLGRVKLDAAKPEPGKPDLRGPDGSKPAARRRRPFRK